MPELEVVPETQNFSRQDRLFIEKIVACGGDLRAVPNLFPNRPGRRPMTLRDCIVMWSRQDIRQACIERLELEETENARQFARAQRLRDPNWRDYHAVENVENAEPGSAKSRALETACVLAGVMTGRELVRQREDVPRPTIYRALQTTTVRKITEEITHTSEIPDQKPEPKALPAESVVVLDYSTGRPVDGPA